MDAIIDESKNLNVEDIKKAIEYLKKAKPTDPRMPITDNEWKDLVKRHGYDDEFMNMHFINATKPLVVDRSKQQPSGWYNKFKKFK